MDFGLAGRKIRIGCGTGPYGAPEVWAAPDEAIPPELIQKGLDRRPCPHGVGKWRGILLGLLDKLGTGYSRLSDRCIERLFASFQSGQSFHANTFAHRLKEPGFEADVLSYMKTIIDRSDPNQRYSEDDLARAMAAIRVGPSCAPPM